MGSKSNHDPFSKAHHPSTRVRWQPCLLFTCPSGTCLVASRDKSLSILDLNTGKFSVCHTNKNSHVGVFRALSTTHRDGILYGASFTDAGKIPIWSARGQQIDFVTGELNWIVSFALFVNWRLPVVAVWGSVVLHHVVVPIEWHFLCRLNIFEWGNVQNAPIAKWESQNLCTLFHNHLNHYTFYFWCVIYTWPTLSENGAKGCAIINISKLLVWPCLLNWHLDFDLLNICINGRIFYGE